jgi:hypothetical protein
MEVNNSSYNFNYIDTENQTYEAIYHNVNGNISNLQSQTTSFYQLNERKIKDIVPEINVDELIEAREKMERGEKVDGFKDIHEIDAAIALAYEINKLHKMLNDPSISDEEAMKLYTTLITYVEYNGMNPNQASGKNMDHGLDDFISLLKKNNGKMDFDWEGSRPDSAYFRELTMYIENALKNIKEQTTLEIPDRSKSIALGYFMGNPAQINYWADQEKEEKK